MKIVEVLKAFGNELKENSRKRKENYINERRERTIDLLDHTWTEEERNEYFYRHKINTGGVSGSCTSAEYQELILSSFKGFLSEKEVKHFSNEIKIRLLLEKRNKLTDSLLNSQIALIDERIKELRRGQK